MERNITNACLCLCVILFIICVQIKCVWTQPLGFNGQPSNMNNGQQLNPSNGQQFNINNRQQFNTNTRGQNGPIIPQQQRNRDFRVNSVNLGNTPINFLCQNRLPLFAARMNIPPSTESSPYTITTEPSVISPGDTVYVRISVQPGRAIMSVFMQAFYAPISSDSIYTNQVGVGGQFSPTPQTTLQSCFAPYDTAVFSGTSADQTEARLQWTAPQSTGTAQFRATIVESTGAYWTDIVSAPISIVSRSLDNIINHSNPTVIIGPQSTQADSSANQIPTSDSTIKATTNQTKNKLNGTHVDNKNIMREDVSLFQRRDQNNSFFGQHGNGDVERNVSGKNATLKKDDELMTAISETFKSVSGPEQSVNDVLLHQGVMAVQKVGPNGEQVNINAAQLDGKTPDDAPKDASIKMDRDLPDSGDELFIDIPSADPSQKPTYVYDEMNKHPEDFEPPQTSEFLGTLMEMAGGGGGGGGGLGSMLGMMKTANQMKGLLGGGGGGGAMPQQQNMMGGGGGGGLPGGLGMLTNLMGAGGGGGGGLLGNLLGGGNKASNPPRNGGGGNRGPPPPPRGGPVNPNPRNEPSLADLLGVDPSTVGVAPPQARLAESDPASVQGISTDTAGGGSKFGSMMKFAPVALGAAGMLSKMGKKKQPQWPPQGMPPQGMPPGMGGMQGGQGQFGMPPQGQQGFGMPGMQGQNGMFGQPQMGNPFGGVPTTANPASTQQILQQLQQAQAQIAELNAKLNSGAVGGGFGSTGSSLFGTAGLQTASGLTANNLFAPPTQAPASNPQFDMLIGQLMRQNQLLMEQKMLMEQNNRNFVPNPAPQQSLMELKSLVDQNNRHFLPNPAPQQSSFTNFGPLTSPAATQQNPNIVQPTNNFGMSHQPQQSPAGFNTFGNSGGHSTGPIGGGSMSNMFGVNPNPSPPVNHNAPAHNAAPSGGNNGMTGLFGGNGAASGGVHGGAPVGGSANTGGGSLMGMFGGGGSSSPGGGAGGGGLAGMLGGGGAGGLAGLLGGGGNSGGGGGGGLAGLLGGGGGGGLAGLLGGGKGGGGGKDMGKLLNGVDTSGLSSALEGKEGQDLMNNMMGLMSGPQGGGLMKAMEGMMSGNLNPAELQNAMSGMDMSQLMSMANQAQGILSKSGIDPSQILGLMGR